jgi:PAS domain S-box-containing protein
MPDRKTPILYVDDEKINLLAFKANFRKFYDVYTAESAAEGREIIEKHQTKIIITDQRMPQMTGVEFFESIIDDHPDTIRILLTGFSDITAVIDSINKGKVYSYVTKPWNQDELNRTIENAIKAYSQRAKLSELQKQYDYLFANSLDPIVIADRNAQIINANPAAVALFNYTSGENIAQNSAYALENTQQLILDEISSKGALEDFELVFKDKDSKPFNCIVSSSPVDLHDAFFNSFQMVLKPVN